MSITRLLRPVVSLAMLALLASCSGGQLSNSMLAQAPKVADRTDSGDLLKMLPPAKRKVVLSVYNFEDQTGQYKSNDNLAEYSRAVTQGGLSILNKALMDAGQQRWFTVIERGALQNLLQERQIIRATRDQYRLPDGSKLPDLGPLLYAGIIVEGGIVSYETNTLTGGVGARYLGIGGSTEYRQDIVTIYLRAVSVQTGEVLMSVNTSKTIFSAGISGGAYKFVAFDKLLEIETGVTVNEPPQFAVRQAIEMGVYSLIMEGSMKGMWEFADPRAGQLALAEYLERRDGVKPQLTQAAHEAANSAEAAPARAPVIDPAQPTGNNSLDVPTGELKRQQLNDNSARDASRVQEEESSQPSPSETQYLNNPTRDKLYCTQGGCYPFQPPTSQPR